ncbi:MAG: LamG domain-containing protein, partial [Xanthomonadaceae bacterium]|nr:LamG domain-containing protein [Xanthomonadaceae bacterium]
MKRVLSIGWPRLFVVASLAAFALSGCSGGADTVTNDPTSPPTAGPAYSGPAPASDDVQAFRINFWENIRSEGRCGGCHNAGGQAPTFARSDDVNAAYQQATAIVDRSTPSQSPLVVKVAGGHNCWEADPGACATILTRWITDWVGASDGGGRQIELIPPEDVRDPGSSKRFPATAAEAGFKGVYDLLIAYDCADCHRSSSPTAQSPFFASENMEEAYQAAIPKMNLNSPENSRFVIRLGREFHNCKNACADDAEEMRAAIEAMANGIPLNAVTNTVVSKASTLYEGTIASGGSRYDRNVIALYEFQTGSGNTAYDTSGVDPAAHLTLAGRVGTDFEWVGGWGIMFKSMTAKAQASTTTSRKLYQRITLTGEYSIEAWVIPGNVTQED